MGADAHDGAGVSTTNTGSAFITVETPGLDQMCPPELPFRRSEPEVRLQVSAEKLTSNT